MRFHISFILVVSCAVVQASDPKTNDLTAREFAAGWVSLFDGTTDFGWTTSSPVKITGGLMSLGAGQETTVTTTANFGGNVEVILELAGGQLELDGRRFAFTTRKDKKPGTGSFRYLCEGFKKEWKSDLGVTVTEAKANASSVFALTGTPGNPMTLRSVKIRLTKTESLFNGQDFSGWKRFAGDPKRELSKFEVTKAGELHLTNGSGDLQTEKSFKDFCLQLECNTNGDRLNSGIFFRCLPGQYQQGYEAQIHNGFKDGDRTKPTDFGTGAIYRRIPTRKIVANDREWFVMTVLAVGPRLRTWVNGYPTVDWVDDRPVNTNARSGRKTDGGPISIQGHDPTTDLLFRNIRITEITTGTKQ